MWLSRFEMVAWTRVRCQEVGGVERHPRGSTDKGLVIDWTQEMRSGGFR